MNRVYLDYNASTPIAPEVAEAMWGLSCRRDAAPVNGPDDDGG